MEQGSYLAAACNALGRIAESQQDAVNVNVPPEGSARAQNKRNYAEQWRTKHVRIGLQAT